MSSSLGTGCRARSIVPELVPSRFPLGGGPEISKRHGETAAITKQVCDLRERHLMPDEPPGETTIQTPAVATRCHS